MLSYLTQRTDGFVNRVPDFNKKYIQSYESMPKFKYELCWLSKEVVPSSNDCSWGGGGDVMLLGDSYAGTLAAGLDDQDLKKYGFSVYAKSSCLPMVVEQSIDCDTFNEFVLKRIKVLTPKTIIISAKWQMYYEENPQIFNQFFKLVEGFDGAPKILLIGSPPNWTAALPSIISPKIRTLKPTFSKIKDPSNEAVINAEKIIRQKLSNSSNVSFFSILGEYCNENGCTPVTESGSALLSFDQGHFTPNFAQEIFSKLLAMNLFTH
jgi:hypothetical protein